MLVVRFITTSNPVFLVVVVLVVCFYCYCYRYTSVLLSVYDGLEIATGHLTNLLMRAFLGSKKSRSNDGMEEKVLN